MAGAGMTAGAPHAPTGQPVRYAAGLPNVGEFGDARVLTDLAVAAERNGWDGVHLWDHVLYHEPDWPVTSPFVAASSIAAVTSRLHIILTINLPRRQVQDVAQDTAAIQALSDGRLTIVTIIGSMDREYADFGLDPDLRARGRALDERLSQLTSLWQDWHVRSTPIWCGGRWPSKPGLRRAARHDGAMPTFADQRARNVPPEEFAAAASFVGRLTAGPIDIAVEGATSGPADAALLTPYAAAGMTWWFEALGWWRGGVSGAASRIQLGPPAAGSPSRRQPSQER
jgi:alkanesulfonate monooxygenase SsuD/methylene tetrahydromethanopterin reductase-like flavin-dependent oxidoreductase (luciferase family)